MMFDLSYRLGTCLMLTIVGLLINISGLLSKRKKSSRSFTPKKFVEDVCSICFNILSERIGSPDSCNHLFCLSCISKWAEEQRTCPLDRKLFYQLQLFEKKGGRIQKLDEYLTIDEDFPNNSSSESTIDEDFLNYSFSESTIDEDFPNSSSSSERTIGEDFPNYYSSGIDEDFPSEMTMINLLSYISSGRTRDEDFPNYYYSRRSPCRRIRNFLFRNRIEREEELRTLRMWDQLIRRRFDEATATLLGSIRRLDRATATLI